MAVDEDGAFGGVGAVAGCEDGGEEKVFFAGLGAEGVQGCAGAEGGEFGVEEVRHLDWSRLAWGWEGREGEEKERERGKGKEGRRRGGYLNDIAPPLWLSRDRGDGDCLAQAWSTRNISFHGGFSWTRFGRERTVYEGLGESIDPVVAPTL